MREIWKPIILLGLPVVGVSIWFWWDYWEMYGWKYLWKALCGSLVFVGLMVAALVWK